MKGIVKRAEELMGDYKYCLGASIGPCCYEIKQDVVELFNKKYKNAIIFKNQKYFLDLKTAVIKDLGNHPEYFYSYRRGDDKKRNYAIIMAEI
jgi:copper oxidase (laccase) domain-containing protein